MSRVILGALPSERPDEMGKPDFLSLHSFPGRPQPGIAVWPAPPTSDVALEGLAMFTKDYFGCFPIMSKASIYISVMWV